MAVIDLFLKGEQKAKNLLLCQIVAYGLWPFWFCEAKNAVECIFEKLLVAILVNYWLNQGSYAAKTTASLFENGQSPVYKIVATDISG